MTPHLRNRVPPRAGRSWTGDSGSCRWMRVCLTTSSICFASLSRPHRQASLLFLLTSTHPISAYLCPLSPASRNFSCRDPRLAHKVMQSIYNPIPHLFYNRKPSMFDIPSIGLRVLMQRRAGFVISRGSKRSSAMISGGIHHRRIVFLSLGVLRNSVLTLHIK